MNNAHGDRFRDLISVLRPNNDYTDPMLKRMQMKDYRELHFRPELANIIRANTPSDSVPAQSNMQAIATQPVTGTGYADATFGRYANEVRDAMATARSGPMATRGGTAAQGFLGSQVVNQLGLNRDDQVARNRQIDTGLATQAAGYLDQAENARDMRGLQGIAQSGRDYQTLTGDRLRAAGLTNDRLSLYGQVIPTFATLGSTMIGEEVNNLQGRGAQTSSSIGGGFNICCFIFLEAYYGEMPWFVRACRDEFAPESSARRRGYIRMSRWLVPLMRVSGLARRVTNRLLIQPLTRWGSWYVGMREKENRTDRWLKNFWFKVWELYGHA